MFLNNLYVGQWCIMMKILVQVAFPTLGRTIKTKWWDALKNDASLEAVKQYFLKNPTQASTSDDMSQFLLKKQQLYQSHEKGSRVCFRCFELSQDRQQCAEECDPCQLSPLLSIDRHLLGL